MERIFHYTISADDTGLSLDHFLRAHGYSHHILTGLKQTADGICLNGAHSRVTALLRTGDLVTVTLRETEGSGSVQPAPLPLRIVYEDADLCVIDKPAHMPIHPSFGNYENTLASALAFYYRAQAPFVCRCVNRLDRDTTGLVIVAKHALAASVLSGSLIRRDIRREYLAVADGIVPESGVIDAPIGRLAGSAIARCVDYEAGQRAVTHYRRLTAENGCSLVRLTLDTGRTHQIRVHMQSIGHPLLGDFLYYPEYTRIKRQALHSHRLTFPHPFTGEILSFVSPLPDDMRAALYTRTM